MQAYACNILKRIHTRKRVQITSSRRMSAILISALRVYDPKCSIAFVNKVKLSLKHRDIKMYGRVDYVL
jgi:hypothetical protein